MICSKRPILSCPSGVLLLSAKQMNNPQILLRLRQKPLTEALNFSARDVRASVPGMSAQQAGIITKHLRRALKARRECTNYSSIH